MRKHTKIIALAIATLVLAGAATAGGLVYQNHHQGIATYNAAYDGLVAEIDRWVGHGTELDELIGKAEAVAAKGSAPGAMADLYALTELNAGITQAKLVAAEVDTQIADAAATTKAAEKKKKGAFWRSEYTPFAHQLTVAARGLANTDMPVVELPAAGEVQEEIDRTAIIVGMEQRIAAYEALPVDGSYRPAAIELAGIAGIEVVDDRETTECTQTEPTAGSRVAAYYCTLEQHTIFIVPDVTEWADPYSVGTMRHELAHAFIYSRCGDTDPLGRGSLSEAVTSSYAALYLGADPAQLARSTGDHYAMTPESDAAARQIYAGCNA